MNQGYSTKNLRIRPARVEDVGRIMEMEREKENCRFVSQDSEASHRMTIQDEDKELMMILHEEEIIGFYFGLLHDSDVYELRRFVIEKKGRGFGREVLLALFPRLFSEGVHRIWLDVYPDNLPGISLYESIGMHRDGTLRQSHREEDGSYRDQHIYSLLCNEMP